MLISSKQDNKILNLMQKHLKQMNQTLSQSRYNLLCLDIGGTLCKLCKCFLPSNSTPVDSKQHIIHTSYSNINECFNEITSELEQNEKDVVTFLSVTGGGAFKYKESISKLKVQMVIQVNQFQSLNQGIQYLIQHEKASIDVIQFCNNQKPKRLASSIQNMMPCIEVNIGSGVSIFKMEMSKENGQITHKRVGGTSLGSGFFIGLNKAINQTSSYEELMTKIQIQHQQDQNSKQSKRQQNQSLESQIYNVVFVNICQLALLTMKNLSIHNILFSGSIINTHKFLFEKAFENALKMTFPEKQIALRISILDGKLGVLGGLMKLLQKVYAKEVKNI